MVFVMGVKRAKVCRVFEGSVIAWPGKERKRWMMGFQGFGFSQ